MPKHGPYNVGMEIYTPTNFVEPKHVLNIPPHLNGSAWRGMEWVIEDILDRFTVKRGTCLEFGVEFCFSTVAFSNFFEKVIGVDTFLGDEHSTVRPDFSEDARKLAAPYPNIELIQSSWENWAEAHPDTQYDCMHIDIVHTYEATLSAGSWAVQHSPIVLFHDTMSFPPVSWACADIANANGLRYFNYIKDFGLGILVK